MIQSKNNNNHHCLHLSLWNEICCNFPAVLKFKLRHSTVMELGLDHCGSHIIVPSYPLPSLVAFPFVNLGHLQKGL